MATRNISIVSVAIYILFSGFARAEPVIWTFYETSCTPVISPGGAGANSCHGFSSFAPINTRLELALPGPNSSGYAMGSYNPPFLYFTGDGDNFSLRTTTFPGFYLSPPTDIPDYSVFTIGWSEQNGKLTRIGIDYNDGTTTLWGFEGNGSPFGLDGGFVGVDFSFGACGLGQCFVTGYWSSNLPEPGSLCLLSGLIMTAGLIWRGRRRLALILVDGSARSPSL